VSTTDPHELLKSRLYSAFRVQPQPLLASGTFGIPAASIWANARNWVNLFRELGLVAGDRIVLALPRTPAHVMVTLAAWWQGLTVCTAESPDASVLDHFDARLMIGALDHPHAVGADNTESPFARHPYTLRDAGDRSMGIALIVPTAANNPANARPSAAFSFANLIESFDRHRSPLAPAHGQDHLSIQPWHDAFGLLVDLWPALLGGATITVEPSAGTDPRSIIDHLSREPSTRLTLRPAQARSVLDLPQGLDLLRRCEGLVGGGAVTPELSSALEGTRWTALYGQAELGYAAGASHPGRFTDGPRYRPLVKRYAIVDGELLVCGASLCAAIWTDRLIALDADRWHATGDGFRLSEGLLTFTHRLRELAPTPTAATGDQRRLREAADEPRRRAA
jgi:acyl-CoA synthetase (AMP-forming)/AMP-acid ligase II